MNLRFKKQEEYRITKIYLKERKFIIPSETYKQIILGLKMLPEHKQEIAEIVKQRFPHTQLWEIINPKMEMQLFNI